MQREKGLFPVPTQALMKCAEDPPMHDSSRMLSCNVNVSCFEAVERLQAIAALQLAGNVAPVLAWSGRLAERHVHGVCLRHSSSTPLILVRTAGRKTCAWGLPKAQLL